MSYDHVRKAYLLNILAQQVLSRKKEMFLSLFLWEEAWNIGIYMPLSTVNYFTKIPITINIPRSMGKNKAFQYCNLYWKTSKSMWSALYMLNRSIRELNDMPRLLYLQRLQRSWQYPQCAEEASSPLSLVCQSDRRTSNGVVTKLSRRSSPCLI